MTEPAHKTLYEALLAVQAEAPKLQKDKINPAFRSKYLSLDALMEQVLPVLNRHGLIWITKPGTEGGEPALHYELVHADQAPLMAAEPRNPPPSPSTYTETKITYIPPERISGTMPLLLSKQDAQGLGSAITYARRYSLMAVLGLVADEDDDGNHASRRSRAMAAAEAPVEQAAARCLTEDELARTLGAINDKNPDPSYLRLILGAVGVSSPDHLTVAHTREIAKRLAE